MDGFDVLLGIKLFQTRKMVAELAEDGLKRLLLSILE
jgi:hypothetical protein